MRSQWFRLAVAAGLLLLAACGGGGGGIGNTPTPPTGGTGPGPSPSPAPSPSPTPTPIPTPTPAPTNALITDLRANQTFTSDATTTDVVLRTTDGVVTTTAQKRAVVQVSYDAATRSYTVTSDGRSQTFNPADIQSGFELGETRYRKTTTPDNLTLVTTPYSSQTSNRYVGLGYWQQNVVVDGSQTTHFSTFTYGLTTGGAAIPRSGNARWTTDIFGLLTMPGRELRTVQGSGDFNVDFAAAAFTSVAFLDETDLVTGGGAVGGLRFQAGGAIGSGNSFNGNMSYSSSEGGTLGGSMTGQFYGPGAEEIGASFTAAGGFGNGVLTGALTGQRSTATPDNLTLLNVVGEQRLFTSTAVVSTQTRDGGPGYAAVSALVIDGGTVTISPQGPTTVATSASGYYVPIATDRVDDGRANYTTYRGRIAGSNVPVEVALYKPGSSNTQLALTYLSFATWTASRSETSYTGERITNVERHYLPYGLATPRDLLIGRTGTASYNGIVVASGASREGAFYEIGGTSRFDVDFSNARYTGSLLLNGMTAAGARRDFGSFGFGSTINAGEMGRASFDNGKNADSFNYIDPAFYGPDGQEIGATFRLNVGNPSDAASVQIGGVAKRP